MTLRKRGQKQPREKEHEICPLLLDKYQLYRKIPHTGSADLTTSQPVSRDMFVPYDRELDDLSPGKLLYLLRQYEDEIAYYERLLDKHNVPAGPPSTDARDLASWKHKRPHYDKMSTVDGSMFANGSLRRNDDLYIPSSDGVHRKVSITEMLYYYHHKAAMAEQRLALLEGSSRNRHGGPGLVYRKEFIRDVVNDAGRDIQKKL